MRERIRSAAHIGLVWLTGYFLIAMSAVAIRAVNKRPIDIMQELKVWALYAIAVFSLGCIHGLWKQYQHDKKFRVPKRG
jgi:hypothetical protein